MYEELVKDTTAYKIISTEKKNGALSHAYLVVCADKYALKTYLKELAKVIEFQGDDGDGRIAGLIDKNAYVDCTFYPLTGDRIMTADVDDLVSKTYIRPLENKTRLFVLCGAENATPAAQNKLLKTLEDPPKGVVILIGALRESGLLSTVLSRVKKIDVPPLSSEKIRSVLSERCKDKDRLETAIRSANGSAGAALAAYENGESDKLNTLAKDIFAEMKSSKDVIKFVKRAGKEDVKEFISALKAETTMRLENAVYGKEDKDGFTVGALVAISEMLTDKEKAVAFSANTAMTIDGVLLSIVREKRRWQKS